MYKLSNFHNLFLKFLILISSCHSNVISFVEISRMMFDYDQQLAEKIIRVLEVERLMTNRLEEFIINGELILPVTRA